MSPGRRKRGQARVAKAAASGLVIGFVLWLAGLAWFATLVPRRVDDPTTPTDAIVVLTGSAERLSEGIGLLRGKMAKKLFISGVYEGVDVPKILSLAGGDAEGLACCIELGHSAADTVGNARETAAWIVAEQYRSLRLVTSDYHMPRSLAVFRRAMPEVELIAHPVFAEHVRMDAWWYSPGTASLLATEFNKFLIVRLSGIGLGAPDGEGR